MPLAYFPLQRIPKIILEETPKIDSTAKSALKIAREEIRNHPHFFDGPTLHALRANDQEIVLCPTTYAWNIAQSSMPTLGSMGVSLMLQNKTGQYLWQKRSPRVEEPNLWDFAAAGTVANMDLEEEIRKEALEEIGQKNIVNLKPEALCILPNSRGVDLLFSAEWSGEEIRSNEEISELIWSEDLPRPFLESTNLILAVQKRKPI